jgi:hypothetical protein
VRAEVTDADLGQGTSTSPARETADTH